MSEMECPKCNRTSVDNGWSKSFVHKCINIKKIEVSHGYYGCESGCCGAVVEGYDEAGRFVFREFDFAHPDEDLESFAKDLISQYVRPDSVELDIDKEGWDW